MGWKQSHKPFSTTLLEYISKIDIFSEMKRVNEITKLRPKCLQNFRIANLILKIGATMGLNLYQIGMILYRKGFEETPSVVEKLCAKAREISSMYYDLGIYSDIKNLDMSNINSIFNSGLKIADKDLKMIMKQTSNNSEEVSTNTESDLKDDLRKQLLLKERSHDLGGKNRDFDVIKPKLSLQYEKKQRKFSENYSKIKSLRSSSQPKPIIQDPNSDCSENLEMNKIKFMKQISKVHSRQVQLKSELEDSPYNEIFFRKFEYELIHYIKSTDSDSISGSN